MEALRYCGRRESGREIQLFEQNKPYLPTSGRGPGTVQERSVKTVNGTYVDFLLLPAAGCFVLSNFLAIKRARSGLNLQKEIPVSRLLAISYSSSY